MNIRTRLTLRFIISVAIIMLMSSVLIYVFSADYREDDFYTRLHNKANNTAKLLIDVDEVNVELLRKIERDNPVSLPNEKIIVYDFRNEIIFSTDDGNVIHVDQALLDKIRLDEEVRFRQGEFEVLGFLFKGRYDRFSVVAAATDIYGFSKLYNLVTILLIVFAISIVAVSASGWIYAGQALRPISNVIRRVDEISITSLNLRVDEGNGKDEIAKLAMTFNNMLARLEDSFKLQKNFIANASHELRTPLTSVTGQLEVSLLNARSNEEYKAVMRSVLDDIKSLNHLANRLLLLAQASAEEQKRKATPVRIDDLLWQVRDELLKANPNYSIHIDIDHDLDDESKLTIAGDEQLLKIALSNIMENACKYSDDRLVKVLINPSASGLAIRFIDNGVGVAPEDLENIFEPFFRGENTKDVRGHGIGLPLTKRIVDLHGGDIEVSSVYKEGTTITLTLPTR